jgi:hypothetical protein
MSDLVERLRAALDEAEQKARAATPGPWRYNPAKQWLVEENPARRQLAALLNRGEEFVGAGPLDDTICVASTGEVDEPQSMADARFIASWDPNTVLRLVKRDRALLEHYERIREGRDSAETTTGRTIRTVQLEPLAVEVERAAEFWLGDNP